MEINEINEKLSLKSVYFNQFRLVQLFIATFIDNVDNPSQAFGFQVLLGASFSLHRLRSL